MFVEEEKKNNINNDVNDNSKVRHIQKKTIRTSLRQRLQLN